MSIEGVRHDDGVRDALPVVPIPPRIGEMRCPWQSRRFHRLRARSLVITPTLTEQAQRLREAGAVMGESMLPVELGRLARAGRLDQLEHLARNGGDMDAADEDGRTCVHLAAAYGHKHIVEFLANLGPERVSLDAVDLQGRTALVYATQQNHQHVVKYLQEVVGQPVEERPRFSAAVTGEFDASPMRYVDDDAPRKPATLMPFSSSRNLGRVDTNATPPTPA